MAPDKPKNADDGPEQDPKVATGTDGTDAVGRTADAAQQNEPLAGTQPATAAVPEEAAKPRRRRAKPKAEGTAAAETGEQKEEAATAEKVAASTEKAAAATAATAPRRRRDARRAAGDAPVVRAQARYVRTSARKARLVCDHIRGKDVAEARTILAFAPRAVARDWAKLLDSAVANAEHNHELLGDDLRVLAAFADEGPTLKRFRPRAMGRATQIRKRTSHLTITLTPKELR